MLLRVGGLQMEMAGLDKAMSPKRVDGVTRLTTSHPHEWVKETDVQSDGTYGYKCQICGTKSKLRFNDKSSSNGDGDLPVEDYERAL
jgi:hypothetical protein